MFSPGIHDAWLLFYGYLALLLLACFFAAFAIIFVSECQVINSNVRPIELDPIVIGKPVFVLGLELSLAGSWSMRRSIVFSAVWNSRYHLKISITWYLLIFEPMLIPFLYLALGSQLMISDAVHFFVNDELWENFCANAFHLVSSLLEWRQIRHSSGFWVRRYLGPARDQIRLCRHLHVGLRRI